MFQRVANGRWIEYRQNIVIIIRKGNRWIHSVKIKICSINAWWFRNTVLMKDKNLWFTMYRVPWDQWSKHFEIHLILGMTTDYETNLVHIQSAANDLVTPYAIRNNCEIKSNPFKFDERKQFEEVRNSVDVSLRAFDLKVRN